MKFVNNALSIGSIRGIPIRLHVSLLILAGFLVLMPGTNLLIVLILLLGIFGSVALHELGHAIMAQTKGCHIQEIVLLPFGGAAKISNLPENPKDEILIALAGPGVSLLLALVLQRVFPYLSHLNWMLFWFNILPVFPMDGGRVLRAALSLRNGRVEATRVAVQVGKYFCGFFVIAGLFGLPFRIGMFGPGRDLMLAFIGGFIYMAGQQELRRLVMEQGSAFRPTPSRGGDDIDVSPPPYAAGGSNPFDEFKEKLRALFRR